MLNDTTVLVVDDQHHIYQCTRGDTVYDWGVQDLTAIADIPTTVLPLTAFETGPYPKLSFSGVVEGSGDVFNARFYAFSQPVWTYHDMTDDSGLPQSNVSLTYVNTLEFAIVEKNENHVISVEYNPTSSFFTTHDLTAEAGIPPTQTPVVTLNGGYPDIQFLSVNESDSHVFGSYYNQPTESGWAVYDFTVREGVTTTHLPPTVISGGQFMVVGTDGHVYNYYFDGQWNEQDLFKMIGLPVVNAPITRVTADPFMVAMVAANGDVILLNYDANTYKYIQTNLTGYGVPAAVGTVAIGTDSRMYIVGAKDGHVYEITK
eukprot:TRINITY_DN7825_c0_g1_i1.p1 TRINITY_DN7825_c0_g1~~TRINITY_DN7825_c0_g1_i1.p1  ORF type:complete len:369 (-),score=97.18 TRINITY_DN7825_c0_g1_i1:208-1158(-)